MTNILTPEDKKNLEKIGLYLNANNSKIVSINIEDVEEKFDIKTIDVNEFTYFSRTAYGKLIPIPERFLPILKKILDSCQDKFSDVDLDEFEFINWGEINIEINTISKKIDVKYRISYMESLPPETSSFSAEEDEGIDNLFKEFLENNSTEIQETMELRFDGGGDSGYIEASFEGGLLVPADIEDFCYKVLSDLYGGWENDEGANGAFYFNTKNKTIELEFIANEYLNRNYTLFEESYEL
jgi:hypothetical protein